VHHVALSLWFVVVILNFKEFRPGSFDIFALPEGIL